MLWPLKLRVYSLGLEDGKPAWSRHLAAELKAKLPECGFAGSPLLAGSNVIVNIGTYGAALDARTGELRWQTPAIAGYAAPVMCARQAGAELLMFAFAALANVDPASGTVLWKTPWPTAYGANAADPIPIGEDVFITSAYKQGCALVALTNGALRWRNNEFGSQCSAPVLFKGLIYGFEGYIDWPGHNSLACLDPSDGAVRWRVKGMAGQLILAGGELVMLLVNGDLAVADAAPDGYHERCRARVFGPAKCTVPPTLSDGRLFCRSPKGGLRCFALAP